MLGLRSILCVPLQIKGMLLGVIYVDNRLQSGIFQPADLDLLTAIASSAATAIENARLYQVAVEQGRLERELQMARDLQASLLPRETPELAGWDFAAYWQPARQVSGDFYDFITTEQGVGVVIADVSGHGVSAGMLMSSLQTAIRTMAPDTGSPAEILERINRFYIHNINFTTFVTVFLARFDPVALEVTYVNAGHNPPAIHRRESDEIHWLMPTAPAIGLAEFFHPRIESVKLSKGVSLLLYLTGHRSVEHNQ